MAKNTTINHTCGHKSLEDKCTVAQKKRLEAVECGACWLSISRKVKPEQLTLKKNGVQLVNGFSICLCNLQRQASERFGRLLAEHLHVSHDGAPFLMVVFKGKFGLRVACQYFNEEATVHLPLFATLDSATAYIKR